MQTDVLAIANRKFIPCLKTGYALHGCSFRKIINDDKISTEDIQELNKKLQIAVRNHEAEYIDLYNTFSVDGQLDKKLTVDGLHLGEKGYRMWKEVIESILLN